MLENGSMTWTIKFVELMVFYVVSLVVKIQISQLYIVQHYSTIFGKFT